MSEIIFNGTSFTIKLNVSDEATVDLGGLGADMSEMTESVMSLHSDFMFIGELLILILLFLVGKSIYGFLCRL